MKRIEASLIKRPMRISGKAFVSSTFCEFNFGALSLFSLSLILLNTQIFLEELLVGVEYLYSWSKKAKEEQESTRGHQDQQLHHIFLQVTSCMYVSFITLYMHGIWMWFIGSDMSLAWRMVEIDSGFPSLSISQIAMVTLGLFSLLCFWLVLMFPQLGLS